MTDAKVFDELWQVICERAASTSHGKSCVRHVVSDGRGVDKSLEKVGEETIEFILAAKNGVPEKTVGEAADLLFHLMVALKASNIDFSLVEEELAVRRAGMHLHD